MEFTEAVRTRRSIRTFSRRDIPDPLVQDVIRCALLAPSSMNGQPWSFVAIRRPETKRRVAAIKNRYCPPEKAEFRADFLEQAPVLIVTCVDRSKAHDRGIETGVLATGHLLLAAADRGLGSVYLSAYRADAPELADDLRRLLGIPEGVDPVTIVPLGFPGEVPAPKEVCRVDEVLFRETFGNR